MDATSLIKPICTRGLFVILLFALVALGGCASVSRVNFPQFYQLIPADPAVFSYPKYYVNLKAEKRSHTNAGFILIRQQECDAEALVRLAAINMDGYYEYWEFSLSVDIEKPFGIVLEEVGFSELEGYKYRLSVAGKEQNFTSVKKVSEVTGSSDHFELKKEDKES